MGPIPHRDGRCLCNTTVCPTAQRPSEKGVGKVILDIRGGPELADVEMVGLQEKDRERCMVTF